MKKVKVRNIILGDKMPKICTSLIGKTKEEIKNESEKISLMDVDIVEWRCDFFENILDIEKICETIKEIKLILHDKPLIFTIRSKEEGGEALINELDYMNIYKKICEEKLVDIIDVELSIGDKNINKLVSLAHDNDVKVIISKHDFEKTPDKEKMIEDLLKMQKLKADIPKLAVMPNSYLDVIKLLEVTAIMNEKYSDTPIITISMGKKGMISRISGQVFGSCLTFASGSKSSAPGQISVDDLHTSMNMINKYYKNNNIFEDLNIMLIGFMGTGKTSVSTKLSELLNMKIIDTDEYIESKENMKIDKIFSLYGEEYFRQCEKNALIELSKEKNTIISCGGGIILKDENIQIMKQQGIIILLTASAKNIYKRVKDSTTRPLLNNNMTIEHIDKLMESRKEKYLKAADIIINTDNKTIEEICNEIIEKI